MVGGNAKSDFFVLRGEKMLGTVGYSGVSCCDAEGDFASANEEDEKSSEANGSGRGSGRVNGAVWLSGEFMASTMKENEPSSHWKASSSGGYGVEAEKRLNEYGYVCATAAVGVEPPAAAPAEVAVVVAAVVAAGMGAGF
ncbi:hypothetical protein FACS189472_11980 [Alphaproteobacteria bacterium]|nr:hypothetical protein FACS189472_11980 [Alphaproteobacteria bacterium]